MHELTKISPGIDDEGDWVYPLVELNTTEADRYLYPRPDVPNPTTDGSATDITLYTQTLNHNYDTGYDYVRQDIRERFKNSEQLETLRDNYIEAIAKYDNLLVSEIPKDATTREV